MIRRRPLVVLIIVLFLFSSVSNTNTTLFPTDSLDAIQNTYIPDDDPTQWNNDHEQSLIDTLKQQIDGIGGGLQETIEYVMAWPNNPKRYDYDFGEGIEELSPERRSFRFADSDLPPTVV